LGLFEGIVMVKNPKDMPTKKSSKKDKKDLPKIAAKIIRRKQMANYAIILLAGLLFCMTTVFIYINTSDTGSSSNELINKISEFNDKLFSRQEAIAAMVNGENIKMSDLDDRYNLIPEEYHSVISKRDVLLQIIDETVLMQQAREENISVTKEEIDAQIQIMLDQNLMTMEDLEESMRLNDITWDELEEFYNKELTLTKLLNDTVISKVSISQEDINEYYNEHLIDFTIPESRNVSHLLICHNESLRCSTNMSKEAALSKIEEIREQTDTENFGDIASRLSDEPAAKITKGNLGYLTMFDPFDSDFLNMTFSVESGVISSPFETVFGYHLILVHEVIPEDVLSLDAVTDQIVSNLEISKQAEMFKEYLDTVKENSQIYIYIE